MALSDAQIDRFSRQIILPQIGGAGQERLLRSSVVIAGDGQLAEVVALYLTGAGIGRIILRGVEPADLRTALSEIDPDVRVTLSNAALGSLAADLLIACNSTLAELDRAASRRPLIAGASRGARGWMVVAEDPQICASCAARHAGSSAIEEVVSSPYPVPLPEGEGTLSHPCSLEGPLSPRERDRVRGSDDREPPSILAGCATGVIGSLMALAALKQRLGRAHAPDRRVWVQFDARRAMLTERPIRRAADCRACAAT